ncbi:MAG: ElaA protein [Gammaproteobacteria bacterium]|jgi:ElaA protein
MSKRMKWQTIKFHQLTTDQLYETLKLRVDIFVVEQTCPYPELDEKDRHEETLHLLGSDGDELIAYARLLAPGVSYADASIGRFAVKESQRDQGCGSQLLDKCLQEMNQQWPGSAIRISAQAHLQEFYEKFNFEITSDIYLEDDIPHVEMLKMHKQ